ncbi:MAG: magnesium transporter [Actinomycetota bacterium]
MLTDDDVRTPSLKSTFLRMYPTEAARLLEEQGVADMADSIAAEEAAIASRVVMALSPDAGSRVLAVLSESDFRRIAAATDPSRLASLLVRLDPAPREDRLRLLDPALAAELRELLTYPPGSAGSLMDPRPTTLPAGATVETALKRLRAHAGDDIRDVFLTDADGRCLGRLPLDRLAVSLPAQRLDDLVVAVGPTVQVTSGIEEVIELTEGRESLPVLDFDHRLIGVIRPERFFSASQEAKSADLQKMVGASKDERALSAVPFAVRKRLPWLNVNLLTAFLAAAVVGVFEGTIARITALAVLQPVVAGQSGNSGAQALAVTMRGLALREVRQSHWRRVALKELGVGLVNGVAIALVTAIAVFLWSRSAGLSLVIAVAMIISMTLAGVAGASVPMVLKALGQDPATASSIVLTTVTDVVGFASFLGLATLFAGSI